MQGVPASRDCHSILQVDVELLPAPENPWGNAFVKKETDLVDEQQAQRMIDASKARTWLVKNPAVRHSINGMHRCALYVEAVLSSSLKC